MEHSATEQLRKNPRYWLEYEYATDGGEKVVFGQIGSTPYLLNCSEGYCAVMDCTREQIPDLVRQLQPLLCESPEQRFTFNVKIEDADQTAEDGERIYDAYVTLLADETGVQTPSPCSVIDVNDSNVDTLCFEDCDTALLNRPPLQTLLELFIRRKQGHMIAFLQENRVVGYLSYFEMFEDTYDVDHIYVAENKRGQGIGTALAKAYVARAIADCKNAFWSSVNPISAKTAKAAGSKLCSRRIFIEKQLTDATEEESE